MNFCPDCENSLFIKILNIENSNKILSFVCNNCNYKKNIDITKEPEFKCVYTKSNNIKKIDINKNNDIYLCKDPTLPHVDIIPCPNPECITNKEKDKLEILDISSKLDKININNETYTENINNVLYKKISESDLTFKYQCCNCNYTWLNK